MTVSELQSQKMSDKRLPLFMSPAQWPFSVKISAHIISMILLTGILITVVLAFQYRKEIYRRQYNASFSAYITMVNYLSNHYKSNNHQFLVEGIDRILNKKFIGVQDIGDELITYQPSHLILYNDQGHVLYEYKQGAPGKPAENKPPNILPRKYQKEYDKISEVIHGEGPIYLGNQPIGFLKAEFPAKIEIEIISLYKKSVGIMIFVIMIAVLFSLPFARHTLKPITALRQAARSIRRGDLSLQVPVTSEDEIGELTTTFNKMVTTLSKRITNIHTMEEYTVRISRELHKERLFELMANLFSRMSGCQSFRFYLYSEEKHDLLVCSQRHDEELPPPDQDMLAQLALQERWSVFLKPNGNMNSEPDDVIELAIPLLSGQNRIGVIRLGPQPEQIFYDDEAITLLQTLAQHASISIDNAQLYEQLAEKGRIEQEMSLAKEIQKNMLPTHVPSLPGYDVYGGSTPAFEVGGDYYDYVMTAKHHWHFIIGDVSGKGVPAALIMSIVRSLFHTYVEFESSPQKILKLVNKSISRDMEPEMFVTVATLDLDPKAHTIKIARAGHEPVLMLNAAREIKRLGPAGAAVGMLEVSVFDHLLEETKYKLKPYDTLLLFTDGITETQNEHDEEFGLERLEHVLKENSHLKAQELYEKVVKTLSDFRGDIPQNDDITLLILKRNGSS
ncbi:MAG: SpoIIE family protein phosphatase [Kiritimatiellae bacterium]|nr:SpoIIE family protein phosphatase [Kiritimatiellia bacterium]